MQKNPLKEEFESDGDGKSPLKELEERLDVLETQLGDLSLDLKTLIESEES